MKRLTKAFLLTYFLSSFYTFGVGRESVLRFMSLFGPKIEDSQGLGFVSAASIAWHSA